MMRQYIGKVFFVIPKHKEAQMLEKCGIKTWNILFPLCATAAATAAAQWILSETLFKSNAASGSIIWTQLEEQDSSLNSREPVKNSRFKVKV